MATESEAEALVALVDADCPGKKEGAGWGQAVCWARERGLGDTGDGDAPCPTPLNIPYPATRQVSSPATAPSAQVSIASPRIDQEAPAAGARPPHPGYLRTPPVPARQPSREAALRGGGSSGRRGAALARVDTRRRSGRSSLRLRRSLCALWARRARHSLPSRPCDTTSSKRARCFLGMKILPATTEESGHVPRLCPDGCKPRPKGASPRAQPSAQGCLGLSRSPLSLPLSAQTCAPTGWGHTRAVARGSLYPSPLPWPLGDLNTPQSPPWTTSSPSLSSFLWPVLHSLISCPCT